MKVAVTGATGPIGTRARARRSWSAATRSRRCRATPAKASREARRRRRRLGRPATPSRAPAEALAGPDGVVHLLGEPIAQRWSDEAKREIRDSRVLGTRNLVAGIGALGRGRAVRARSSPSRPAAATAPAATSASTSRPAAADDFLAEVTADWEAEARAARRSLGLRVALTRTGVVLSETGGALEKMLPPFKLGVGGPVAGGRQYVPWIHTRRRGRRAASSAWTTPRRAGP